MQFASRSSHPASAFLNTVALLAIVAALILALAWQIVFKELPCPLCLLQRVAFVLAGVGLLLNLRFGASPAHYAMVIAAALAGIVVSARQLLLHQAPGDPGYGSTLLGLHFYTWALIAFLALIGYCAVMLALDRRSSDNSQPRRAGIVGGAIMWLFFLVVLANAASTTLECGFGACPDNPSTYQWLVPLLGD
ncbi:disulfide bond formation protein DsbB [Bordetella sp. H567]|uniref:disulfide bond formation protein B n=1 Tax=Bordetella sp. H567 TaxID=1697043 RepID=UPI00081CDE4F|nr:disulfide bond formation protein B [Bordetella sp. H567]AOB30111.1 disulfide bond formation protein DsbB [Bordetella sp. H567]